MQMYKMNTQSMPVPLLERYKGCLMGLAIGDALGAPFEFWKKEKVTEYLKNNELELVGFQRGNVKLPAGFYTDDTSLALCLASSLVEKGFSLEDQFSRYRKWLNEGYLTPLGSSYGVGQQTYKALRRELARVDLLDGSDDKAGGNGSLMRCAPIGLYYQGNLNEIKKKSLVSSYITHNNLIAGWSCVVLNSAISLILEGKNKREILKSISAYYSKEIPTEINDCLIIDYNSLGDQYPFQISGYSLDTLRIALWSWLTSENYVTSIKKVIMLGNDTDTFAAITGSLTGCYYGYTGMPEGWRQTVINKDTIGRLSKLLFEKSRR